eukprot:363267-Chlamydomonas_euryale.AAC.11
MESMPCVNSPKADADRHNWATSSRAEEDRPLNDWTVGAVVPLGFLRCFPPQLMPACRHKQQLLLGVSDYCQAACTSSASWRPDCALCTNVPDFQSSGALERSTTTERGIC